MLGPQKIHENGLGQSQEEEEERAWFASWGSISQECVSENEGSSL